MAVILSECMAYRLCVPRAESSELQVTFRQKYFNLLSNPESLECQSVKFAHVTEECVVFVMYGFLIYFISNRNVLYNTQSIQ